MVQDVGNVEMILSKDVGVVAFVVVPAAGGISVGQQIFVLLLPVVVALDVLHGCALHTHFHMARIHLLLLPVILS